MRKKLYALLLSLTVTTAEAQIFDQTNSEGPTQIDNNQNRNFNKHNNDTTSNKEIPTGLYVWTIDRKFGDVTPAIPDTVPHLYPNTTLNTGLYGQYNTTGNNYTARENRIVIDRPLTDQFIFTQPNRHRTAPAWFPSRLFLRTRILLRPKCIALRSHRLRIISWRQV